MGMAQSLHEGNLSQAGGRDAVLGEASQFRAPFCAHAAPFRERCARTWEKLTEMRLIATMELVCSSKACAPKQHKR